MRSGRRVDADDVDWLILIGGSQWLGEQGSVGGEWCREDVCVACVPLGGGWCREDVCVVCVPLGGEWCREDVCVVCVPLGGAYIACQGQRPELE